MAVSKHCDRTVTELVVTGVIEALHTMTASAPFAVWKSGEIVWSSPHTGHPSAEEVGAAPFSRNRRRMTMRHPIARPASAATRTAATQIPPPQ